MAERILLTGASGVLGRALVAPLAAQGALHAVARRIPPGAEGATWHAADLLDEGAARALIRDIRPTLLVHAAWYVAHGAFWTAPENEACVEVSDALAAAFAAGGGRRMLGIGSCAEYAVASGEGRAIADVARVLGREAGRENLLRLGALPDRTGEVPVMVADVARLRREVGFDAPPMVEHDLRALLAAFQAQAGPKS